METIIELNNIKIFERKKLVILIDNLTILKGSFVCIIGPNGAGKTTLLTTINGLTKTCSGTIKIFDKKLSTVTASNIRKDIGYVPQKNNIDPRTPITVFEAVLIGRFGKIGMFKKITKSDIEITQNALRLTNIQHLASKPIGHLSGGEQQKVSIARVLAQEPKIILFDEPTTNLDPKSQYEILDTIDKIYSTQKYTIIFVTHILSHIPECSTEIILMKNGTVIKHGPIDQTINENILSDLYNCKVQIMNIEGKRHFHYRDYHL